MGIQDTMFDVIADVKKHCPKETVADLDKLLDYFCARETEADRLRIELQKIKDSAQIIAQLFKPERIK